MQQIEFQARIKDGRILVPRQFRRHLGERVKVVLVAEETDLHRNDIIDELIKSPVKIDNFSPLGRDEIYE